MIIDDDRDSGVGEDVADADDNHNEVDTSDVGDNTNCDDSYVLCTDLPDFFLYSLLSECSVQCLLILFSLSRQSHHPARNSGMSSQQHLQCSGHSSLCEVSQASG